MPRAHHLPLAVRRRPYHDIGQAHGQSPRILEPHPHVLTLHLRTLLLHIVINELLRLFKNIYEQLASDETSSGSIPASLATLRR